MFVALGATLALFVTSFVYLKFWYYWPYVSKIIVELKMSTLGVTEVVLDIVNAKHNKTDLPCKTGCVAIVTGGSRGIGESVVKMLLQCDMEVIIACRRVEAGQKTIEKIRKSGVTKGKPVVYELDNASLSSVRKFSEEIRKSYENIHVLINNAGVLRPPYAETIDGFEQQWAVNYLSHFLLTALLMPLLRNAGTLQNSARVINVTSNAQRMGNIYFNDINNKNYHTRSSSYCQSKLAQVIFTKTLDDMFKQHNLRIRCYTVHPGLVNTEIFKDTYVNRIPWYMSLWKTPEQGAIGIIHAAVNEDIEGCGGSLFYNCQKASVNPLAEDKSVQEKLLEVSLQQTKLDNFLQYL